MKSKILSIAFALCMLSVVFTALPGEAAVYYTGTVQTTDDAGESKDVFFRGDWVYVNVELFYENIPVDADIRVTLETETGGVRDTIYAATDTPVTGYYNSSEDLPAMGLNTAGFPMGDGNIAIGDVVLYVDYIYYAEEVARAQVMIKTSDMWLEPDPSWYYSPGQNVTITMVTGDTDEFYVQVLDPMGHDVVLPWTGQTVDDTGTWTETFMIPLDAEDGNYLVEVRSDDPSDALWFDQWFYVAKFVMILETERWAVLPGETFDVSYMVIDLSTLSIYEDVDVEWNALWYDMDGELQVQTGVLTPSYSGTQSFVVPAEINLTSDYEVHFWANDSADRSMHDYMVFEIAYLMADVDTDSNTYLGGEIVTVTVEAMVGYNDDWSYDYLPDADVDIVVEKDGEVISAYGATNLMTGETGTVQHEFGLSTDAEQGTYIVTATVSKVDYSVTTMTTFVVELEYGLMVELDKTEYFSGEVAYLKFTTMWGVDYIVNNSVFYVVYGVSGMMLVGNSSTGTSSFTIPADYVGSISVNAITIVNDHGLEGWDSASVRKAYIALAPMQDVYSAGDTIQWEYRIVTMMTTGLLSYVIEDDMGNTVGSATLSSMETEFPATGTISYTVPADDASSEYTLTVTLKDGIGNNAEADSTVYLTAEYKISVWLVSDAGFVSRAFEPGDTLEFGYEITTNGAAHKSVYKIRFYSTTDSSVDWYVLTSSTTGTLTVTVPENTPDGMYSLQATLYEGIYDGWLWSDGVSFSVMGDQSFWQKEVGGMSVIDLTILLLIIVMIVLLIVVPFMKGRMGGPKPADEPAPAAMAPEEPQPGPPPTQ